jgi:hypothetical protein
VAGGLWTPADITTSLWLDPSDPENRTIVSSAYSGLTDLSGNGNDATQGTAANRPALSVGAINGLDAMDYDNVNDYMTIADDVTLRLGTGSFFIVAVVQFDTVKEASNQQNTIISKNFTGFEFADKFEGDMRVRIGGTSNPALSAATLVSATTYLVDAMRDGSSLTCAIDSVRGATATNSTSASQVGTDVFLGARPGLGSTLFMGGLIGEIIISTSIADLEKAQGYLAHKWGTESSLPGGHPYKSSPP